MTIGTIIQWASNTLPTGWLLCDGSAVSRTTYADLFDVIGTTFGSGDGSTTFNLPDLRGRVAVGKSSETEFDTLGETGGSKELQAHTHGIRLEYGTNTNLDQNPAVGNKQQVTNNTDYPYRTYATETTGTGDSGNLQPYIVVNYIIKATTPDSIKISELEELTSADNNDVLPIVDTSANETKKIALSNLLKENKTYVAAETAIGTWIDGKIIYRQIITGVHYHNEELITGVDKLINFYGMSDPGTGLLRALPYGEVYNDNNFQCTLNLYQNAVRLASLNEGVAQNTSSSSIFVIEYTKTTD